MMRTAGLMMNDVWAHRVLHEQGVETHRLERLDAELGVLVQSLDLKHKGKEENYRPYLHVTGELRSVTPGEVLPFGISQVTYSPGQGGRVDCFYEFDDDQLVALIAKGYFTNGFAIPGQLTNIEWELPAKVDMLVLAPSGAGGEGDVPVIFTQVHDIGSLEINRDTSGYDLADYFADRSEDTVVRTVAAVDDRGLKARSDAINSLFTDEELALGTVTTPAVGAVGVPAPSAAEGVSARLQQVEAEIAAEAEQFRAERERTEGTPENLYRERVANSLQNDGEEFETRKPLPDPTLDERKREVARRAADLDFGQDTEQGLGS
ncbi:hypothetical protein ACFRAU_07160 [Arthrobacter sp. NPDC056691]|uniref:hypothetical protein n=1 Tax=Arthrobacter sp. NPDC056691 TaxID=3345913 RepID=UPI00366E8555